MSETNIYNLESFKSDGDNQQVVFYKLNKDGSHENGTTLEAMLEVSIARLEDLQFQYPCRENSLAITKMEEALMWLNKRTEDRTSRGVEGRHEL